MWKTFAVIVAMLLGGGVARGGITYNLANDWSDTSNSNGPWTYEQAPGKPLPTHYSDYDPLRQQWISAQPAWAITQAGSNGPNSGSIPVIYKAVSSFMGSQNDQPLGHVYIHNNDPSNSIPSDATSPASIAWTAPAAGTITITGDLWEVSPFLGRTEDWSLVLNGVTITGGAVTPTNATSANPLVFSSGSGGSGVLVQTVFAGEVLRYEVQRDANTAFGTYTGIDLNINLLTSSVVPEPNSLTLVGLAGAMGTAVAAGRRRKSAVQWRPMST